MRLIHKHKGYLNCSKQVHIGAKVSVLQLFVLALHTRYYNLMSLITVCDKLLAVIPAHGRHLR